jgi:hypothetical protein
MYDDAEGGCLLHPYERIVILIFEGELEKGARAIRRESGIPSTQETTILPS